MKNTKFKAGEYVRVKKFKERPRHWNREGKMDHFMGCIVKIEQISFTGNIIVYDPKWKYKWSFKETDLEKINNTIVIYQNGNETIALNKATGEKAAAKCHPDDEFDFEVGAKLAFQRLVGSEDVEKDEALSKGPTAFKEIVDAFVKIGFTRKEAIDITIHLGLAGLKSEE